MDSENYKSPQLISNNVSMLNNNNIFEKEEDEEKNKFEAVGLKSYNSQIQKKIISDEKLANRYSNKNRRNTLSDEESN